MIYHSLQTIEDDLRITAENMEEYESSVEFMSGYDTATDVATCCNETSIWNKVQDFIPVDLKKVMIARSESQTVEIGWVMNDAWHGDNDRLICDVIAWAELPDYPCGLGD